MGVRAKARAELTEAIVAEARSQLREHGAAGLSLRAVARSLGLASSAIYRYFASRDELLTRLIVDAYDSLGAAAEAADAAAQDDSGLERWCAVASAVRKWAVEHPEEYALVYGSPVPGYAAPPDTVLPGTRVSRLLVGIVVSAAADGTLEPPSEPVDAPAALRSDIDELRTEVALDGLDDDTVVRLLGAWTGVFGLLSFELFGQLRGIVSHHELLFDAAVRVAARDVGLR